MKNINQTTNWKEQGLRYVQNSSSSPSNENLFFKKKFSFFLNKKIKNMLDIGCGNGDFLNNFIKKKE